MALSKQSIAEINSILPTLQTSCNNLAETYRNLQIELMRDHNYQAFVNSTDIGKELNIKLAKLFDLVNNISDNELKILMQTITGFVNIQESLNN